MFQTLEIRCYLIKEYNLQHMHFAWEGGFFGKIYKNQLFIDFKQCRVVWNAPDRSKQRLKHQ